MDDRQLRPNDFGGALVELAIVAPVLLFLMFTSVRLSVLTSSVPIVEENLYALLQSLLDSSYEPAFDGFTVKSDAVRSNVEDLVAGPGQTNKAGVMLGIERLSYGVTVSAFSCPCGGTCDTNPIHTASVNAGTNPDVAGSETLIQQSCTLLHSKLADSWACKGVPALVCYGATVRFGLFFATRELGAVAFDHPEDNLRLPGNGAASWLEKIGP